MRLVISEASIGMEVIHIRVRKNNDKDPRLVVIIQR